MTSAFKEFQKLHQRHEFELMGAVRFLSNYIRTQRYRDIDRPKLKALVVSFGGMAPNIPTPVEKPNGPAQALSVQRIMRRRYLK